MGVFQREINLRTARKLDSVDVTDLVNRAIQDSGIKAGVCTVFVPHTTAAVIANEHFDPNVPQDILRALGGMVPEEGPWDHPEENATAHVKASVTSSSLTVPVTGGEATLGRWQGIYFMDYDGPRTRRMHVTVIGE